MDDKIPVCTSVLEPTSAYQYVTDVNAKACVKTFQALRSPEQGRLEAGMREQLQVSSFPLHQPRLT